MIIVCGGWWDIKYAFCYYIAEDLMPLIIALFFIDQQTIV